MEICEILKSLRIENGLTQKELSNRLKIGQATIACYENGQREPHIQNIIAYADYFECSVDFLLGRTDNFGNVIVTASETQSLRLTEEERALLVKYKSLDYANQMKAQGYLDGMIQK